MPFELSPDRAVLTGHVAIEDAEQLLDWLRRSPDGTVDVGSCTSMHMAVLQLLVHAPPVFEGTGSSDWHSLLVQPHTYQPTL